MMKSCLKALGDFLTRAVPSDLNAKKGAARFWKNHEPRPGWRTNNPIETDADAELVCYMAEEILIQEISCYGLGDVNNHLIDQLIDISYSIAERMLARRKAYLSTFESRD